MRAATRCLAAAALLVSSLAIAGPSVAQTTRSLTVTPDADLADGDVVQLDGAGFTPSSTVYFCQGTVESTDPDPDPSDCGATIGTTVADSAGEFTAQYTVQRFLTLSGVTVDCAQPSAECVMGAANLGVPAAVAPITFTPLPPLPPPALVVTPDTDLVDGDAVTLDGEGFVPSSEVSICQAVLVPFISCGPASASASTNDLGEFSTQYTVRRFIAFPDAPTVDCAAPTASCGFYVADLAQPSRQATAPITFVPQPPPDPIFGMVTDPAGNPVAGADVWAYTPSDTWVGSLQTTTGADGSYSFDTVDLGVDYRILVRHPSGSTLASQWFDNRPTRETASVVSLSSGEFRQVDAQLEEGGTISGSVTDPGGNPVAGADVRAFGPYDTWVPSYQTSTGPDGSFRIENLRGRQVVDVPGYYWLQITPPTGSDLANEWYDDARTRRRALAIAVNPGESVTGVDVQLDATGAISGAVADGNGSPVAGVTVRVYGPGDGRAGSYVATTAADGSYLLEHVRTGDEYNVYFVPPSGSGLAAEWYDDAPTRSTAQDVSVAAGQTLNGIDAVLAASP